MAVAEEKKRIQVTLPLEIWRDLDDYAKSRGVAKSSMAGGALARVFGGGNFWRRSLSPSFWSVLKSKNRYEKSPLTAK